MNCATVNMYIYYRYMVMQVRLIIASQDRLHTIHMEKCLHWNELKFSDLVPVRLAEDTYKLYKVSWEQF